MLKWSVAAVNSVNRGYDLTCKLEKGEEPCFTVKYLLLGILLEDNNAVRFLNEMGVDIDDLVKILCSDVPKYDKSNCQKVSTIAPSVMNVYCLAQNYAVQAGFNIMTSDALFAAALSCQEALDSIELKQLQGEILRDLVISNPMELWSKMMNHVFKNLCELESQLHDLTT